MSFINSKCLFCKLRLNCNTNNVVVCNDCSTISHKKCFKNKCEKCKSQNSLNESELIEGSQNHINVKSTKKTKFSPGFFDILRFLYRILPLIYSFLRFYIDYRKENSSRSELIHFLTSVHHILRINVTIKGEINSEKRIYIANHSGEHDAIIIPRYFDTAVISSIVINKTLIGKMMKKYSDVIEIERGVKSNVVDKIENYLNVKDNKSLFLFPTGIFDNIKTISKFRTGAFVASKNTNIPIQIVAIKYKQDISSMDMIHILMFKNLEVEIDILDTIFIKPEQTCTEFSEEARNILNNKGGFELSNIDSRDVTDSKNV